MPVFQKGFTLVEVMVALAIGTMIILGAGQLFLTTFQTFQKVDELSRKQETLVFAASSITNRLRNGTNGKSEYRLECKIDKSCECTIYDDSDDGNAQPVLDFVKKNTASNQEEKCADSDASDIGDLVSNDSDLYRVLLPIESNGEPIVFHVASRKGVLDSYIDESDDGTSADEDMGSGADADADAGSGDGTGTGDDTGTSDEVDTGDGNSSGGDAEPNDGVDDSCPYPWWRFLSRALYC